MLYIFLLITISQSQVLEWEQNLYKKLFHSYTKVIQVYSSSEFFKSQEYQVCTEEIYTDISYKHDVLYNMIRYSGKGLLEVGSEEECLNNKMAYFLLIIIKYNDHFYSSETASDIFIDNRNSFSGFCVMKDCVGFIEKLFDAKHNPGFHEYLGNAINIYSVQLIRAEEIITTKEGYDSKRMEIFVWCIFALFVYLIIKIIIFFFGITMYNSNSAFSLFNDIDYEYDEDDSNKDNSKNKNSLLEKLTNQSLNDRIKFKSALNLTKSEKEITLSKLNLSKLNLSKSIDEEDDKNKMNNNSPLFHIIYVIFSFDSGINLVSTTTNLVYNSIGLDMFNFFRVWALFWMTYQHNLWALIRIPTRDIANVSFFKSFYFSIVKYSIYSPDMYIIIDGLILGYKLMIYTKQVIHEKNTTEINIKALLSFYINILPKAALFIFVFFMFHFFTDDYVILFNLGTMFKYFTKNFIYCRECMKNPMILITNPIKFLYLNFINQDRSFINCFKFVHIFMNEFICCTGILIIFYISFRLKNKKFDYSIFIFLILNIILSFLSMNSFIKGELYSLNIFMGESSSLKYTHLFINTYLIGFFLGISIFYYRDMISKNPLGNHNKYRPFSYCHKFIIQADRLSKNKKLTVIIILIIIQSLLSCSFYFLCHTLDTLASDGLNFTHSSLLALYDKYEKILFIISYTMMILFITIYPNDTLFKQVYSCNIFSIFSRVGFSYFCSMDTMIYMFYSLCKIELHLSYLNLLIMTIGLVFILSFVNGIIVMLIELPIKIIIKLIKRRTIDTQSITRYSKFYLE